METISSLYFKYTLVYYRAYFVFLQESMREMHVLYSNAAAVGIRNCCGGAHRCGCAAAGAYAPWFARRANVRPALISTAAPLHPS
ncbi:MAG: hypothetical protein IJO10_00870, partial [Clostridia bacterium]|nr:hypothetical protein [Clostridia bacterium]